MTSPIGRTDRADVDADQFNRLREPRRFLFWRSFSSGSAIEFKDKGCCLSALTHASGAEHRLASNERLEFLGDAILGAVVCEILFQQYPEYLEGDLTRIKSIVVSRQTCAKISEALGMQEFLILGKGMTTHPSVPSSLLADVFESLVAAIYLDGGDEAARQFITDAIGPEIELAAGGETGSNYKSLLAAIGPAGTRHHARPTSCSTRKGPTTASASRSRPRSAANRYQPAWGRNKKEAEQRAARNALSQLSGQTPPCIPTKENRVVRRRRPFRVDWLSRSCRHKMAPHG